MNAIVSVDLLRIIAEFVGFEHVLAAVESMSAGVESIERNIIHLAPRAQRGGYLRVFYKNLENNPMQSRMPKIAALVLHAFEKKKWPVVTPHLIPSRSRTIRVQQV